MPRRLLVGAVAGVLAVAFGVVPAQADTVPDPGVPETVSADALPTVQIDGVVWAQVIVGNTVYVGGNFQTARPAGSAPGVNTVNRPYILAYDITTGVMINSFAPNLNGQVLALAASPDGTRIYATGDFTTANGLNRYRLAAFNAANGAVLTNFTPGLDYRGKAIVATADTVYVGGAFNATSTYTRTKLAAFSAANGVVKPWAPAVSGGGNQVAALALTPDGSKIIVGGNFTSLAGSSALGLGAVDAVTGARVPWAAGDVVKDAGVKSSITTLVASGNTIYGGGYVTGAEAGLPKGNLEGQFAADASTGAIRWINSCHGDTYSVTVQPGIAYSVGHAHDCRSIGGFPQTNPWTYKRAIALVDAPVGVNQKNIIDGYFDWAGTPAPGLLNWFPDIEAGTFTGQSQGAWSIASNSDYVVIGGEFPTVNGTAQQGLARFARKGLAPNKSGPVLSGADYTPAVVSPAAGLVRGSILADYDEDNQTLSYRVMRQGSSDPILATTVKSTFYNRPMILFSDPNVVPGQSYNYRVIVTDPFGNTANGDWSSVTVANTGTLGNYPRAVMDDGPLLYWRLDEPSGTGVTDAVGRNNGVASGAVTRNAAGALAGDTDTATSFAGDPSKSVVYTSNYMPDQQQLAVEAWFKTTTTKGGKIIGFGNGTTGDSGKSDRMVYMLNNGKLSFGVNAGTPQVITSPASYNDGKYHHVVAQLGPSGAQLFVDGNLVANDPSILAAVEYNGYWRIGGDSLTGWPNKPTSGYFAGTIDEAAVYQFPLSVDRIKYHYQAGTQVDPGTPVNVNPTAAFTSSHTDLNASFDASASNDPDGTIASYSWDFGDGRTGSGATVDHAFAGAGTYTVRLTVTDNQGGLGTTTQDVSVTAPNPAQALDQFDRTVANGWGSASPGGSWIAYGVVNSFAVNGGVGKITVANASQSRMQRLSAVSSTSTDTTVDISTNRPPDGSPYSAVMGRSIDTLNDYRVKLRYMSNGDVSATLNRNVAGVESTLAGGVISGLSYNSGDVLRVRLQVSGTSPTTLRAKIWRATDPEPSNWLMQATDNSAGLQVPGSVALWVYLSNTVVTLPVTVNFGNLTVYAVQ